MKSAQEILKQYERTSSHFADQDYDEDGIIEAMKVYARQAVEEQRKLYEAIPTYKIYTTFTEWVVVYPEDITNATRVELL